MTRTVLLTTTPLRSAQTLPDGLLAITPNRHCAATLQVAHVSLGHLATRALGTRRISVADDLTWRRHLRIVAGGTREADLRRPAMARLLRAGVDLEALSNATEVGSGRAAELAGLTLAYVTTLERQHLLDPAHALRVVVRELRDASYDRVPLAVVGFPRLEPEALELLDRVAGDGSVIVLPSLLATSTAAADWLVERGWQRRDDMTTPTLPGERLSARLLGQDHPTPEAIAWRFGSDGSEIVGVLGEVKRLLIEGVAASQITLVAREEQVYAERLLAAADEMGVPLRLCHRVPLRETRLGAWLAAGAQAWVEAWPYEATLRWLGLRWHAQHETLDETTARRQRPRGAARWQALGAAVDLTTLPLDGAPPREWADWLQAALDAAVAAAAASARDVAAQLELQRALQMMRDAESPRPWTVHDLAEEVADWLDNLTVAAQPGRGGVELHTPLALYGSRREHVFVLGAVEGRLPLPVADDPYLDFREREAISAWIEQHDPAAARLETAAEAAQRETASFAAMLEGVGTRVVLGVPATLEGRPTEASPYVARLCEADPVTPPKLLASRLAWRRTVLRQPDTMDDVLPGARHALAVELRRESDAPPDAHDGCLGCAVAEPRRYSVSSLVALGQCPFRWFAGRELGLEPLAETAAEPEPSLRGSAWHRAVQLALAAALALGLERDAASLSQLAALGLDAAVGAFVADDSELAMAIAAAVAASPARRAGERDEDAERADFLGQVPNWRHIRNDWVTALRKAVSHRRFLPDGVSPEAFEVAFSGEWHGLPVHGFIDRIDRCDDGSVVLIDYKAGRSAHNTLPDESGALKLDLQLALYREVYAVHSGQAVSSAAYYLRMHQSHRPRDVAQAAFAAFAEDVRRRFAEGDFGVRPDPKREACTWCDLDPVCRCGPRVERKR